MNGAEEKSNTIVEGRGYANVFTCVESKNY